MRALPKVDSIMFRVKDLDSAAASPPSQGKGSILR